jgi:sialate O-acetylesterase
MKRTLLMLIVVFYSLNTIAALRLPKLFGNQMVFQRNQPIVIWGWANKQEKIKVKFAEQINSTVADSDGKWKVSLKPMKAGGPYTLTITAAEVIQFNDILIGEVWVCSGQSNMEFQLKDSENAAAEIENAAYSQIRQLTIPKSTADQPQDDLVNNATWVIADAQHAAEFTAVGYYFAKELYKKLKVPIGLIHSSWGGTDIETWISLNAFKENKEFQKLIPAGYRLNLDSISNSKKKIIDTRIQQLQGRLSSIPEIGLWKGLPFDDQAWPVMQLPGLWENQSLPDFDGAVWFRKVFYLDAADIGKPAVLKLGMIDDSDESYINGVKVGGIQTQYYTHRVYQIPAQLLKAGKNVIAVRVEDTGYGGGIYGEDQLAFTIGDKTLNLNGAWKFQVESVTSINVQQNPNNYPTLLFNGMINPLTQFQIRGVIWYQGENNAGRAYQYRKAFPMMINDWRGHWNQGSFPFYFVQLSSFHAAGGNSKTGSSWAELREAQKMTLSLEGTGMAVTTDVGDTKDIHPKNKKTVGERLAVIALNKTYKKGNVYSTPDYKAMVVTGNKIVLSFNDVGKGLKTKDGTTQVKGFEIAGLNQDFKEAKAYIEGDKVIIYADEVVEPIAVRYAWADDASKANLFNIQGFPVTPFRTDVWKGITEEATYKFNL